METAAAERDGARDALVALCQRRCAHGACSTALERVTLFNCTSPTPPTFSVYEPRLCVVLQGAKEVVCGGREHVLTSGDMLLTAVDLPVVARVSAATSSQPHLAIVYALDLELAAEVVAKMAAEPRPAPPQESLLVLRAPRELLDPLARLLRLLDAPSEIPVMRPAIERELVLRLLQGRAGSALSGLVAGAQPAARIAQAIQWIKANLDQPLRVADLASRAGMSATTFHRRFKAVTSLSPIAYRGGVRLAEARRRLLAGAPSVATAAFAVGYENASQFSREYRRAYRETPSQTLRRHR